MKTYVHLWQYRAEFLEWEMFQAEFVEYIKTYILCSITFFFKSLSIYEIKWKNMLEPVIWQYGTCALRAG